MVQSQQIEEHEATRARLDAYCAGALDDVEWVKVRTHLAGCDACRAELLKPMLWRRAWPRRILPPDGVQAGNGWTALRPERQRLRWQALVGTATAAAVVAFGLGHALATSGW